MWSLLALLLQRTTQSDHPVVLCVAQGQSHEACPEECPIRAVVFPSPVPSVFLWCNVVLLRLCNFSAAPKTHQVALCLCASVVPAQLLPECGDCFCFLKASSPSLLKSFKQDSELERDLKNWVIRSVMVIIVPLEELDLGKLCPCYLPKWSLFSTKETAVEESVLFCQHIQD